METKFVKTDFCSILVPRIYAIPSHSKENDRNICSQKYNRNHKLLTEHKFKKKRKRERRETQEKKFQPLNFEHYYITTKHTCMYADVLQTYRKYIWKKKEGNSNFRQRSLNT